MKTVTVKFTGISPISFSRMHDTPKKNKESHEDYEKRTWKEKVHYINDEVVLTPFMIKNMLSDASQYLGIQIPGKGKNTYKKHFDAGVLVTESMPIGVHKDNVQGQWMLVPSNGKPGPGPRVKKCFPVIPEWAGVIDILILDDTVTTEVLKEHLQQAGKFIGMGSLRPRNRGIFGRFTIGILETKGDID